MNKEIIGAILLVGLVVLTSGCINSNKEETNVTTGNLEIVTDVQPSTIYTGSSGMIQVKVKNNWGTELKNAQLTLYGTGVQFVSEDSECSNTMFCIASEQTKDIGDLRAHMSVPTIQTYTIKAPEIAITGTVTPTLCFDVEQVFQQGYAVKNTRRDFTPVTTSITSTQTEGPLEMTVESSQVNPIIFQGEPAERTIAITLTNNITGSYIKEIKNIEMTLTNPSDLSMSISKILVNGDEGTVNGNVATYSKTPSYLTNTITIYPTLKITSAPQDVPMIGTMQIKVNMTYCMKGNSVTLTTKTV